LRSPQVSSPPHLYSTVCGASIDLLTMLRWRAFGNARPESSPTVVVAIDEETFRTPPFEGSPSVTWTPEIGRVLSAIIDGVPKLWVSISYSRPQSSNR
jgi:hypothetical protein